MSFLSEVEEIWVIFNKIRIIIEKPLTNNDKILVWYLVTLYSNIQIVITL